VPESRRGEEENGQGNQVDPHIRPRRRQRQKNLRASRDCHMELRAQRLCGDHGLSSAVAHKKIGVRVSYSARKGTLTPLSLHAPGSFWHPCYLRDSNAIRPVSAPTRPVIEETQRIQRDRSSCRALNSLRISPRSAVIPRLVKYQRPV